ncbi:TlpA disulfide reductase family protein [Rhodanobacter sp. DHG33]|uniref:TlpA family protein disulfide reductase n=1 Tax=Rhodanobacter sp. DHG33 TaxID=2775921 RepID=UPI00177D417D|nr:TlpA disulfide reductase family protein [Rhodanobacter sp. DHG33]MBD8899516.1 TlpA family protein disulfide reductase [Rhodanobacter sp. DHG33]
MPRLPAIACLLASLFAGSAAYAQTAAQKQQLISAMLLPSNAKITFLDSSGRPIGYDDFMRQARTPGASFSKDVNAQSDVVLRINSAHQAPAPNTLSLKLKPGAALPAFDLRTAQGQRVTNADFKGHYTLLSFYFAECIPCIAEVPTLNALALQHKDFKLLAVTYDPRDTALAFAKQRNLRVPSLVGAQSWIDSLGVTTYPALLLIDPQGRLVAATVSTALATTADRDIPTPREITQWAEQHRKP